MKTIAKQSGDIFPPFMTDFIQSNPFWTKRFSMIPSLGINIPSANVRETDLGYQIDLAAPGLNKKDFKIELDNDILTISVEKENEEKKKENGFAKKEYSYNMFSRSFIIPENTMPARIDAKYEDGVLKIKLPKAKVSTVSSKREIPVS